MQVTLREIIAGILALILILTFCSVTLFQVVNGKPVQVPDSLLAIVSGVVGVYFGAATRAGGADAAANHITDALAAANGRGNAKPSQPGS